MKVLSSVDMQVILIIMASSALGMACLAQIVEVPREEAEIRKTFDQFFAARLKGDGAKALSFLEPDAGLYAGGGFAGPLVDRVKGTLRLPMAEMVREIKLLTPDSAVAMSTYRVPRNGPPLDAGARDIFLVRREGGWRIAGWRNIPLDSVKATVVAPEPNPSTGEGDGGWKPLFDGRTMDGWVTMAGEAQLPSSWRIEAGCFVTVPGNHGMSLRTRREFETFELSFEWAVAKGANSGVKYRLFSTSYWNEGRNGDGIGYEYQIADDEGDQGARRDRRQKSGALYGVVPVAQSASRAAGEWNQSTIRLTKDHVEHWLNGSKVAEYGIDLPFASPIVLQHHRSEVRFRNIRIRE
jgi:hypothetical protein